MDALIPKDLREFQVGIGTAILVCGFRALGRTPPRDIVRDAPEAHHIVAAELWREEYRSQLKQLAEVARRAENAEDGKVLQQLKSDLDSDLYGVATFLQTVEPAYVSDIFRIGTGRGDEEKVREFLRLLQAIAQ